MRCNIDAHGKARRFRGGIAALLVAFLIGALMLLQLVTGLGWWIAAGVLAALGAFAIFEARAGWCAMRAMGIRTKW